MPIYNGVVQQLDKSELRRYAGLNKLKDNSMDVYLDQAAKMGRLLIRPGGIYQRYAYDREKQMILGANPLQLQGKSIAKHLAKSEAVYVLAVTVGADLELESSEAFKRGDYTMGILLDAAATTAVEQVADQLDDYLKKQARKEGYTTTWRFSPGYGDWGIGVQNEILALAQGDVIGVSTTSSLMLNPQKSVTAIIGLMPVGEELTTKRGCTSCGMRDCPSRKI